MDETDKKDFATAIGAMLEAFGQQATTPILHGYWLALNDLPLPAVQVAVAMALRTSDRAAKPVELRRLCGEQNQNQRAMAAWGDVLRSIGHGPYKHLDFGDKLINATIRFLGGWPSFVGRFENEEAEKWARHEFIKAYESLASSNVNGEAIAPLPGLSEKKVVGGKVVDPIPLRIECAPDRAKLPVRVNVGNIEATRAVPALTFKKVD